MNFKFFRWSFCEFELVESQLVTKVKKFGLTTVFQFQNKLMNMRTRQIGNFNEYPEFIVTRSIFFQFQNLVKKKTTSASIRTKRKFIF